jgi:hypothetical protein
LLDCEEVFLTAWSYQDRGHKRYRKERPNCQIASIYFQGTRQIGSPGQANSLP